MAMQTLEPTALSARTRETVMALANASMPPGERIIKVPESGHVIEQVGLVLASMPSIERWSVIIGLGIFEWITLLFKGRTFTRLAPDVRTRWMSTCAEHPASLVRLGLRALLTVIKPAHFSHRVVQAQMGYQPDRLDGVQPVRTVTLPPEQVFHDLQQDTEVRCQVVVVGTGAGGGTLAAELAERGVDVVLIEAGRNFSSEELGRDPCKVLREVYQDGATTIALGRPSIPIPLGKSVGGTTTINSGTCFRLPEIVASDWADLGLPMDQTELDACFSRVEERIHVKPVPDHLLGGSSHVIARGAAALNLEHGPLSRNIDGCHQSGVCAFGCPRNAKQSTNITYVPWALEAGARLYTGMRAERLLRQGDRAVGVVASPKGGGPTLTVHADVVVSACGSISGVPFLQGVGLRSRHLGRHLAIHPCAKIVAQMPEQVNGWADTPQGYGISSFSNEGLMFEGAFVPPEYTAIAMPFVGRALTEVMETYPHLAMFGFMVRDMSVGRVRRGPGGRAVITYQMAKSDLAKMKKGMRILAEVFFEAGAERIFLPIAGIEEQGSFEAARTALEAPMDPMSLELAAFHPMGTARMSVNRRSGVVDPDLESWEIPGLYVVDASVFPTALGVNPQLTVMAYATRAAERIAARVS